MRYLILFFLFGQSIFAQINFKVLDGFVTGSPEYSFIKAELMDFNNDGSPEIAYYFKKNDNYLIKIRDVQGSEYFLYTGISDTGKTLENIGLFNFNNSNYVALIYKFSGPPLINELKFSLKIIDLSNNALVDSVEGYAWDYNVHDYTEISFHTLKVLESETSIRKILLGLKAIYEYYDIGETYGTNQYARTMIFNFNDSLYFSNSLNNSSNVFPLSEICYGYETGSVSGVWGSSQGEDFRIYHLNDSGIITEGDEIFHYSSNSHSFRDFKMLSSDDSTNYYLPIIIGNDSQILYAISRVNGSIDWEHNLNYNFGDFTASANLSFSDGNYIIYFSHYKMQIRKRDNGQLIYYDPATSINPISILETKDKKLYFIRAGGTQSIFLYEIDDSSSILSVENVSLEKPNEYFLHQNYPNPFNPSTTIKFTISDLRFTTLKVYDLLGREVATLVNEEKPAGNYEVEFYGTGFPSGIYFYRLRVYPAGSGAGNFVETKKMVFIK